MTKKDELLLQLEQKLEALEQAMLDPLDNVCRKMSDKLGDEVRELQKQLEQLTEGKTDE